MCSYELGISSVDYELEFLEMPSGIDVRSWHFRESDSFSRITLKKGSKSCAWYIFLKLLFAFSAPFVRTLLCANCCDQFICSSA